MNSAPFPHLLGGQALLANKVPVVHVAVPTGQRIGEGTTTAAVELGSLGGTAFGLWEMSAGSMYDVEAEEIFVVTAGRGTVVIEPFNGHPARTAHLVPGTLMRLDAGMKTTWTITQTLRKIYFTTTPGSPS